MTPRPGRRGSPVGVAVGIGVLVVVVGLLVVSPRHRHFYSRLFEGTGSSSPTVTAPVPAAPRAAQLEPRTPSPPTVSDRSPGFAKPIVPDPATQRLPSLPPVATDPSEEALQWKESSQKQAMAAVPRGGPGDRVVVKILDKSPTRLPMSGPPASWELKEFAGRAQVDVVRDEGRVVFRLSSERSSFALYRDVVVDIKEYPLLTWSWKVSKLPAGGDIRERATDDQAAQVYVIFPRWPFPRINSDVLGYIWDTRAPVGLQATSPQSSSVKLTVLQNGAERLGQWVQEERNVYQDYVNLFGKEPPQVGKVAIMIDSNDTRSQAESLVGELVFQRVPIRTGGIPLLKR